MKTPTFKKTIICKNGIGFSNLEKIYNQIGLNHKKKVINIKLKQHKEISNIFNQISHLDTLKNKIKRSINFYMKLKSYRGMRHALGYPVRGQRTHTNAQTRKKTKKYDKKKNTKNKKIYI